MDTIEGNKLIGEFDGGHKYSTSNMWTIKNHGLIHTNDLKYHFSWDWLMPVWRKYNFVDAPYWNEYKELMMEALLKCDIESAHKILVNAIQCYNKEHNAQVSDTTETK